MRLRAARRLSSNTIHPIITAAGAGKVRVAVAMFMLADERLAADDLLVVGTHLVERV
jgi:hypothetical protein